MDNEENTLTTKVFISIGTIMEETKKVIKATEKKVLAKQKIIEKIIADYNKIRIEKMAEMLSKSIDDKCDKCGQTLDPNKIFLFQSGYDYNEHSWRPTQILRVCRDCSIFLEARNGTWTKCDCGPEGRQTIFIAKLITSTDLLKEGTVNDQREEMVMTYLAGKNIPPEFIIEKENEYITGIFFVSPDGKINKIEAL